MLVVLVHTCKGQVQTDLGLPKISENVEILVEGEGFHLCSVWFAMLVVLGYIP